VVVRVVVPQPDDASVDIGMRIPVDGALGGLDAVIPGHSGLLHLVIGVAGGFAIQGSLDRGNSAHTTL